MIVINIDNYHSIPPVIETDVQIIDHMGGFTSDGKNEILSRIENNKITVYTQYILDKSIKDNYPNLNLVFDYDLQTSINFSQLANFASPFARKEFKNFVCSFSGHDHVSRQFLIAALYKFGWFDIEYNTKNFVTFGDRIDGNISSYFNNADEERFYRKFILSDNPAAEQLYSQIISVDYKRVEHLGNLLALGDKINSSFVQIVAETVGASYCPYITEKFQYPTLIKTLWVSYAQPQWHQQLTECYGFKLFNKIFDYSFDRVNNPVIRLVDMLTMLSKFEKLSVLDWHDLYLLEHDTIEYNYNWYRSKKYLEKLKKHTTI